MAAPTLEHRLRPRKVPRQARAADTRARILSAAAKVFAEHGYAAGTTNRIADAAGLSVGSLYQYFPNKDAVLVELVRGHIEDGTAAILAAAEPHLADGDLTGLVRAVVQASVDVHVADRRLHRVLFEESPRPPSLLAELATLEDEVVATLASLLRAVQPDAADHELRARIVVVTIESLVHRLVATDRPLDADRLVDEATRLVTGYLGPTRAARSSSRDRSRRR